MTAKTAKNPSWQSQLFVFAIAAVLLLPWLGLILFNSKGEPREAIVAVSILQSGEWILPVNYGTEIPFKPPFLAWLIAGFAWLFNGGVVNEYISRLPSALAAIAMIMAGYRWCARLRGERVALVMAMVTLTSVEVFRAAIACRLDMVVTAGIVISMYLLYDLRERDGNRLWRYFLTVLCMTAATLTKGPIGSLLPCLVMGVYYLMRGERWLPTIGRMLAVCLLSMILPALWFWTAAQQGGDHFVDLMMEENIGRLTGTMSYESHVNPWYYNFMTLAAGMAPWTLLMLFGTLDFGRWRRDSVKPVGMFALMAFALIVGFYCIPASKRSVYLLPVYPMVAYFVTCILLTLERTRVLKTYVWILAVAAFAAPVVIALAAYGYVPLGKTAVLMPQWWQWPLLAVPMAAGACWIFSGHRQEVTFAWVVPASLLLAYAAVVGPMVLNPKSDSRLLPVIAEAAKRARTGGCDNKGAMMAVHGDAADNHQAAPAAYASPRNLYSWRTIYYTLNYYEGDAMRRLERPGQLDSLPVGSVVIYNVESDSVPPFGPAYRLEPLTNRGSDYRNPLGMAVKLR